MNALLQLAAATVNCRVLPEDSIEYVQSTLEDVFVDKQVNVRIAREVTRGPPSPLRPDVMRAVGLAGSLCGVYFISRRQLVMRGLLFATAIFLVAIPLFAADPFVGTWKLDSKETKYTTGDPPKDVTLIIEEQGDQLKVTATGTYADGSPLSVKYTVPVRGGAAKVEEGAFDAMTAKRVSTRVRVNTYTKNGKEVATRRFVVSKDGKELTETVKGTDARGKPVDGVDHFDRQ